MARGVKRSISDRVAEIDEKIAKKQAEIDILKVKRRELTDLKKSEIAAKVVELSEQKGISLDELYAIIESK